MLVDSTFQLSYDDSWKSKCNISHFIDYNLLLLQIPFNFGLLKSPPTQFGNPEWEREHTKEERWQNRGSFQSDPLIAAQLRGTLLVRRYSFSRTMFCWIFLDMNCYMSLFLSFFNLTMTECRDLHTKVKPPPHFIFVKPKPFWLIPNQVPISSKTHLVPRGLGMTLIYCGWCSWKYFK